MTRDGERARINLVERVLRCMPIRNIQINDICRWDATLQKRKVIIFNCRAVVDKDISISKTRCRGPQDIGEPWSGTREEEGQWVRNVQRTLVAVRQSGLVAVIQSPHGGSLTFSRAAYGKTGMAQIADAHINEDPWNRLGRALGEKNEQASGNLVWLRMGEYAGLWHWSRYRAMTLPEKVQSLSPLVQAALALRDAEQPGTTP